MIPAQNSVFIKYLEPNAIKQSRKTPISSAFPGFYPLLELGTFFVVINYICLSFMQIYACFYFNYIIYSGLLIFCCQNVATFTYLYNENHIEQSLSYYLLCDRQYDSHHLFADSNMMPNHHLTFLVFQFLHTRSGQYLLTVEEYASMSSYPAASNIQNLPMPSYKNQLFF